MADQDNRVELTLVATDKASPVVVDANKRIADSAKATAAAAAEAASSQVASEGTVEESVRATATAVAAGAEGYSEVAAAAKTSAGERELAEVGVQEALAQTARAEADVAEGAARIGTAAADGSATAEAALSGVAVEAGIVGESLTRLGASSVEELASAGQAAARLGEEAGSTAEKISEAASTAAAALARVTEAASAAGPAAAGASEKVVSAAERIAKAAADEAEALGLEGSAARAALEQVEAASARIERAISGGGRGLARSLQVGTVAAQELEAEIARLGAEGKDVSALEARLESLRAEIQLGATRAGQLAATHREVAEAVHAAQRAAGEYEGTLGNLREVVSTVSPSLGKVVGNVLALHAGSFILIAVAKQLIETLQAVGKAGAKELEDHLDELDRKMRIQSGESAVYANNLKNVLAKQGYDVAGDSITELVRKMDDYEAKLRSNAIAAKKAADAAAGNQVDLGLKTKEVLDEIDEAEKRATENSALHARLLFEPLNQGFIDLGEEASPALTKVRDALAEVADKGGDFGKVAQSAIQNIESEIKQYELLGKAAPAALTAALVALKQLASESSKAGRDMGEAREAALLGPIALALDLSYQAKETDKNLAVLALHAEQDARAIAENLIKLGENASPALAKVRDALAEVVTRGGDYRRVALDAVTDLKREIEQYELLGKTAPASLTQTLAALKLLAAEGKISSEVAKNLLADVEKQIAAYERLGQQVPAALLKQRDALQSLARTSADVLADHEKLITAMGIQTPEALAKSIKALLDFKAELELSGSVTVEQAQLMLHKIEELRKAIAQLPEDQRSGFTEYLKQLDQLEAKLRETGDVARETFGIKTPQEIQRSVESLKGLIAAVGPIGSATKEQAEKVASAARQILEEFALVTPAEREANAGVIAWAKSVEDGYSRASLSAKSFATNTVEALKRAEEQLKSLKHDVESVGDSLLAAVKKAQSDKKAAGDQSIADLKKQVSDLENKNILTVDEENQLSDLKQKLNDAESAAHGLGVQNKQVAASSDEVNAAIARIIQSLGQNKDAWNSLDESQRQAIQNYLEGLQLSADAGQATGSQIENVMKAIQGQFDLTGVSVAGLTDGLGLVAGKSLDISKAFAGLDKVLPSVAKGAGDATTALSSGKIDAADKSVSKLGTDFKDLGVQIDEAYGKLSRFNELAGKTIPVCNSLTECLRKQAAA